jgi:hypothetical protein
MTSPIMRTLAGLAAGAVGFYLGLYVLLAVSGLSLPGWAPVTMVAGAGMLGGATTAALSDLRLAAVVGVAAAATSAGAVLGALLSGLNDAFEWTVLGAALLVVAASVASSALSNPSDRRPS